MKEFENEIQKHVKANMSKIEDGAFTSRIIARHLLTRKSSESRKHFNFEALIFWTVLVLISIALLILTLSYDIGFYEIQVKHSLILMWVTLTALIYKWLEKIYST